MKKLLLLSLLIAGASQLKAQQLTLKPGSIMLFKTPNDLRLNQFKLNDSTLFKSSHALPTVRERLMRKAFKDSITNTDIFYNTMPIARLSSNDRMPVARLGGPDMNYTMLVKRITVINPLAKQSAVINP
jgi:hypothetical protein